LPGRLGTGDSSLDVAPEGRARDPLVQHVMTKLFKRPGQAHFAPAAHPAATPPSKRAAARLNRVVLRQLGCNLPFAPPRKMQQPEPEAPSGRPPLDRSGDRWGGGGDREDRPPMDRGSDRGGGGRDRGDRPPMDRGGDRWSGGGGDRGDRPPMNREQARLPSQQALQPRSDGRANLPAEAPGAGAIKASKDREHSPAQAPPEGEAKEGEAKEGGTKEGEAKPAPAAASDIITGKRMVRGREAEIEREERENEHETLPLPRPVADVLPM